jgi:alpha-galactosidase
VPGERFIETAIGDRLTYRDHETVRAGGRERTTIRLADSQTGLAAEVTLETGLAAEVTRRRAQARAQVSAPARAFCARGCGWSTRAPLRSGWRA